MEITALTRIGALLDAHPELEEALIRFMPSFANLRNPVLRATVARVATLEQAARVGGIPLPDLLAFLGRQLGQPGLGTVPDGSSPLVGESRPEWFRAEAVVARLDAGALMAGGKHPLAVVKQTLAGHPPGAIVLVASDFEPAPLLARMREEGILAACCKEGPGFVTCLRRP